MPTHDPQTVLLPSNLGSVKNYGPAAPLARVTAKPSLHNGRLYLRATLDEIIQIQSLSRSLDDSKERHDDLLRETRAQYDNLLLQHGELESYEKRNWIYKLFKFKSRQRARRTFLSDAFELWDSAATTSDRMKRNFLSTPSTDLTLVESESVAEDEQVSGLAVDMNGPVTQEAIDTVREAALVLASVNFFPDTTPLDSQDGQTPTLEAKALSSARSSITTSPSSPGSASSFSYLNLNLNYNVVNNTDSTAPGFTINNNGSGNSGSTCIVTDYRSSVNSPPILGLSGGNARFASVAATKLSHKPNWRRAVTQ